MKIYNKKGFISAITAFVLSMISFILLFIKEFSIKSLLISLILFVFSMNQFSRSLSRSKTLEDLTINNDERDKYIELKTSHKTLDILGIINFLITIALMTAYGITRNNLIVAGFIVTSSYMTIACIIRICCYFYYEKRQ